MEIFLTIVYTYLAVTAFVFSTLFIYAFWKVHSNKDRIQFHKTRINELLNNQHYETDIYSYMDKNPGNLIANPSVFFLLFFFSSLKQSLWTPNLIRIPLTYTKRIKMFDSAILTNQMSYEEILLISFKNEYNLHKDIKILNKIESQKLIILTLENKLEKTLKALG